jgi:hypothetical protein
VKSELLGNDASHDWNHIERVWNLTKTIAAAEELDPANLEVVQVAALLHDINDWKYSGRYFNYVFSLYFPNEVFLGQRNRWCRSDF